MNQTYIAIDLKSYYASAECVDRELDPLTTNLVVADESRTDKTICLAVSPSLKAYGIPGRARLFEVIQKVKEINQFRLRNSGRNQFLGSSCQEEELKDDFSLELSYIVAPPRMAYYVSLSSKIYSIYLKYISPEDICVYSIDEVLIDVTGYLKTYRMSAHQLAMTMIRDVLQETGITATAGIGSNLYLAKIAMDIVAKKIPPDKDGVRIAELTEQGFREQLWGHTPLTDFWMTGPGTAKKLAKQGIYTMGDIARQSLSDQEWFYRVFGVDAEIMIDHAWGIEPCGMREIKNYKPENSSICEGQVLTSPYPYEKARKIVQEMTDSLVFQLMEREMVCSGLVLDVRYDRENCDNHAYTGETKLDHYGRTLPKPAHGTARTDPTNLSSKLMKASLSLFDSIVDRDLTIRKISITAINIEKDTGMIQVDLFQDPEKLEKEKNLQKAMMKLKEMYGKNAVLKGTSYEEGSTMIQRNGQIGGHKA